MAQISWSVVGLNITEAERAAATAAGDLEAIRLATAAGLPDPTTVLQKPIDITGPQPGTTLATGTLPNGMIGTAEQMFAAGYVYVNGVWVKASEVNLLPDGTVTIKSASTVASASDPAMDPQTANYAGTNQALQVPFAGGPTELIRMTTGIGAGQDGPLTPIREGITGITRIMIDEQYT